VEHAGTVENWLRWGDSWIGQGLPNNPEILKAYLVRSTPGAKTYLVRIAERTAGTPSGSRSNQRIAVFGISVVVCERSAAATSTAASIARSRAALGSVAADWAKSGKSSSGNDMA
jgi:hypothetical protein